MHNETCGRLLTREFVRDVAISGSSCTIPISILSGRKKKDERKF
jgi:hypothetical protein